MISIEIGGIGYHAVAVQQSHPEAIVAWLKISVAGSIIYIAAICMTRIVILSMYLRLFITRTFRFAAYSLIAIFVIWTLIILFVGVFECVPLEALWNPQVQGKCMDVNKFYRYGSLPSAPLDVILLVLPIPAIWKLHASTRVRVGLTLTFLTGSIGMIIAIVRTVTFFQVQDPSSDTTWTNVPFQTWCIVESGCYLIASCLPRLLPILNWVTRGQFDPKSYYNKHSNDTKNSDSTQGSHQLRDLARRAKNYGHTGGFAAASELESGDGSGQGDAGGGGGGYKKHKSGGGGSEGRKLGSGGEMLIAESEKRDERAWKNIQISQFATPALPPLERSSSSEESS
ncbi:MAG: hypothetical protein M1831_000770, partial [Alyxoria varia]